MDFALFTLQVFKDIVLKNPEYVKLITLRHLHPSHLLHGHGGRATTESISTTA